MESLQNPAAGRNSMQKLVQNNKFWAGMSKASYLAPKKIVRPQSDHEGLLREAAK